MKTKTKAKKPEPVFRPFIFTPVVSKKPKRIRAVKAHIDQKGGVATTWEAVRDDTPYAPCYILRQSDIRALAEQMAQDFLACGLRWNPSTLYALKRAGMTPGKGTQ